MVQYCLYTQPGWAESRIVVAARAASLKPMPLMVVEGSSSVYRRLGTPLPLGEGRCLRLQLALSAISSMHGVAVALTLTRTLTLVREAVRYEYYMYY